MRGVYIKNEGKIFEDSFAGSCPAYVLVKRLNDNAAGWSGGSNTRFSSNNECDFIMLNDKTRTFYGLELKSTKDKSLTFWRKDFETENKKQAFQIRKCQIQGLEKWSSHLGVFGFVFNFRSSDNETYFVSITDFLEYTNTLEKKSINVEDIKKMNPIKIENNLVRTRYRYDIEKFLQDTRIY